MKKYASLIYLCMVISLINIFFIIFNSQQKVNSTPAIIARNYTSASTPQTRTTDVFMPEKMSFAGEEVPLQRIDVQEAFRRELIVNTYLHSHTLQILKTAPRIFYQLEPILKEAGIPDDFKYLAVIESQLNPLAVSPAGAVGVWQFMEDSAKELDLEVNKEVDERYNIEKATQAAAAYLKREYKRFGSWTMAAAAYNAGAGMVGKQMNIQQEKDYYNLLLGEETGRYVFRILALKQIMNNPQLYNFEVDNTYLIEKTEKVEVKEPVKDWAAFAKEHDITYKTLKRFNPWLRKTDLSNPRHKTYEISIPVDTKAYK